ncbi:Prostaglandin E2 receptor EP3 subtype [Trichinella spiralis]|uniref:Prostaglandin E2 receptor EP3 subtype n=1 Tax=Trichinella spiralis TaxID=6334 RepID=A0ABR3KYA7_TRISP
MIANDLEQVQNNSIAENTVKRNDTLQLISLSVGIYHIVEDLNYACIPLGIVIFLMQGFASVAIIFNSKLRRKRTFLLICMLCISWTIVAAGEICSAVGTLVRYSLFNNCVITQYSCFIEQTSLAAGLLLVIDTNLLTAVDRCLAIITPHWYRKQYKLWMVYMVIFFAILHVFISRLQRFFNNQGISVRHDSDASKNTSAEKSETCSHSSVRILHSTFNSFNYKK